MIIITVIFFLLGFKIGITKIIPYEEEVRRAGRRRAGSSSNPSAAGSNSNLPIVQIPPINNSSAGTVRNRALPKRNIRTESPIIPNDNANNNNIIALNPNPNDPVYPNNSTPNPIVKRPVLKRAGSNATDSNSNPSSNNNINPNSIIKPNTINKNTTPTGERNRKPLERKITSDIKSKDSIIETNLNKSLDNVKTNNMSPIKNVIENNVIAKNPISKNPITELKKEEKKEVKIDINPNPNKDSLQKNDTFPKNNDPNIPVKPNIRRPASKRSDTNK